MDTGTKSTKKKRFTLSDAAEVRATLCKIGREYYHDEIDPVKFRNLVYYFNTLIAADKAINDAETNKRIELLESYIKGEGGTVVDNRDIDSPYAQGLKKQLVSETKVNAELNAEILSLKRQLADIRDSSRFTTDSLSVGAM